MGGRPSREARSLSRAARGADPAGEPGRGAAHGGAGVQASARGASGHRRGARTGAAPLTRQLLQLKTSQVSEKPTFSPADKCCVARSSRPLERPARPASAESKNTINDTERADIHGPAAQCAAAAALIPPLVCTARNVRPPRAAQCGLRMAPAAPGAHESPPGRAAHGAPRVC